MMLLLILYAALHLAAAANLPTTVSSEPNEVHWLTDYAAALEKSNKENRPLLIDFFASWCGPCRQMDKTVYSDASVTSASRAFVCVKIDIDKDRSTALAYKINAIPRLIILNVFGEIVADQTGYTGIEGLLSILATARGQTLAHVDAPLAPERREERVFSEWIALQRNPLTSQSLLRCWELLGDPDAQTRKHLLERLPANPATAEKLLWAGLNAKYLGTRLACWEYLSKRFPEIRSFDPWAAQAVRQAYLSALKRP
jgi:thiol-disulfide isomerase/thioredoxin